MLNGAVGLDSLSRRQNQRLGLDAEHPDAALHLGRERLFGTPVPAGVVLNGPAGDDFTPAVIQSISMQTYEQVLLTARAPLPLLTNQWDAAIQRRFPQHQWLDDVDECSGTSIYGDRGARQRHLRPDVSREIQKMATEEWWVQTLPVFHRRNSHPLEALV